MKPKTTELTSRELTSYDVGAGCVGLLVEDVVGIGRQVANLAGFEAHDIVAVVLRFDGRVVSWYSLVRAKLVPKLVLMDWMVRLAGLFAR